MIEAKKIITLGPPPAPINDVRITTVGYAAQGGYELHYRPVTSVLYLLADNPYPWATEQIVIERRYSFGTDPYYRLTFYDHREDHKNTKQGRCECGYSTCNHLGLWEGTELEIVSGDDFQEILAKRLEYLVKVESRAVITKEKRLAKIAADPAGHAERLIKLKEKRDAKKAELAKKAERPRGNYSVSGQWPGHVAPR
jgi:hypothetical protein